MKKLKFTGEEKKEIKATVSKMPIFPRTKPDGSILVIYGIFQGKYVKKKYGNLKQMGYNVPPFKVIQDNIRYRIPGYETRNPQLVVEKAMKEGNISEAVKKYYDEYAIHVKYLQSKGIGVDNTNSSNND